ncbi:MAG: hypothetical protein Q8R24_10420 [Legionellaceae bacterium]|nr:hypothetical protein [Legionellaceae bacterium]
MHKRYLVSWFHDHVILIAAGFATGFSCLAYLGWKAGTLNISSTRFMQIARLFVVYLAQYWSLDKPRFNTSP